MNTHISLHKWASVAAIAASTLFVAPATLADVSVKTQISKQHFGGNRHNNNGRAVTVLRECGSSGYRQNTCHFDVGFPIADARVHDRKSKGSCDRGDEWGIRGNSMWIRDGCRAIFELSSVRFPENYDRVYDNDRYNNGHENHNRGYDRHNRHGGYQQISHYQEREAIGSCAREASQQAYRYNAYSAQYTQQPRVEVGRHGSLRVTGIVRVHSPDGFRNRSTQCSLGRDGRVDQFSFGR
ncbi:DUF3011 domain-containing protein [Hirschia litorea]|uniref:DUF3011 domain-containing protein n=1 Tax=Hirschia litorea TaxID=1199156 RepID=A0ABW2IGM6_9PROT